MAQTQGRDVHIAQTVRESKARSRKILGLRKEVKALKRHIKKEQDDAAIVAHFNERLFDGAANVILKIRPPKEITPTQVIYGIKIYTRTDVTEAFGFGRKAWEMDYDELSAFCRAFELRFDCTSYSAEKEDFSLYKGAELALKEKKSGVIVENLS